MFHLFFGFLCLFLQQRLEQYHLFLFDLLEQHGGVVYADTVAELADQITTLAASPSQSDQLDNGAFNASRALANQAVSTAQQILAFDRGKNPTKNRAKGHDADSLFLVSQGGVADRLAVIAPGTADRRGGLAEKPAGTPPIRRNAR